MEVVHSLIIALCVVLSSFFGQKFKTLRKVFTVVFSFAGLCIMLYNAFSLYKGAIFETLSINFGIISLNFGIDASGIAFASLVSLLWGISSFYSFSYMETNYPEKDDTIFQIFYSLAVFLTVLFAFAKDILTMFIIYELITISTIPLIGFKGNKESKVGLFKYLFILFGCSFLFLLPSSLFIIKEAGIQMFDGTGFMKDLALSENTLKILLLCLVVGVGKAAMFPFHAWLPSAMCAPTPVSGLLHAVAVVKVGAFFILRVIHDIFGMELLQNLLKDFNFIMFLSGFTIIYSSVIAVFQVNLKKRLAYSTIGQISYIILSLSTFTKLGFLTAISQIVSHGLSKILLFFTVGGFYTASHSNRIISFAGMAQKDRLTCTLFLLGTLSICGLPFTVGFLNKGLLFYNLIKSGSHFALFALFVSAFFSFVYLIPVCYAIFQKVPLRKISTFSKIPKDFKIVFVLLAILNITVFALGSLFFIYYVNEW